MTTTRLLNLLLSDTYSGLSGKCGDKQISKDFTQPDQQELRHIDSARNWGDRPE